MEGKMKKLVILAACFFLTSVSGVRAQDFCEGNFNYDKDVDGTDAALFKSDFGRSQFQNPCPPDGPSPVPKTGQTECYDASGAIIFCQRCNPQIGCWEKTGQDGMWEKGAAWPDPRFTDNGNGTATDNLTGLIWLKDANCFGGGMSWQQALDYCNNLSTGQCGLTDGSSNGDWRLPNRKELFSLTSEGYYGPAVPSPRPFTNIFQNYYWTSSNFIYGPDKAWYVFIFNGSLGFESKTMAYYVWPVRGGQ